MSRPPRTYVFSGISRAGVSLAGIALCALFSSAMAACTGSIGAPRGAADTGDPAGTGEPGDGTDRAPTSSSSDAPLTCTAPSTVGSTPLQRLTRAQYARSVSTLLEVAAPDVGLLPEDEKVGAFDGNAVAPVSELVLEQYASLAEALAKAAAPRLEELVPCDVASQGQAACAARFASALGRRVYRRPLSSEEESAYAGLYAAFATDGHVEALRVVTAALLQSPHFLYRVELTPADGTAGTRPLDAFELASRLSFFLVGGGPDDALLDAAGDGSLLEDATLAAHAARLLDDPRADGVLEDFHLAWLGLDGLRALEKSPSVFTGFDASLPRAMEAETRAFVRHVLREDDGTLDTLLTAPYSFPSGPLLELYGVPAAASGEPVQLDPNQRAGLLTQPAFLAVHAHAEQSSPVLRGKVVIRNLLCQTLPDPPPNVVAKAPEPSPGATTRERFEAHEADPACAGCHVRIDGVGFGFESFDALGAYREEDSGKPVDARGKLLGTQHLDGEFTGAVELAHKLAASDEVAQCFTRQWFRFALGRMEATDDACALDDLTRGFSASQRNVRSLLTSIVASPAFRTKRVPETSP
jgi:Protein of unknown function (DUF1592)/Protein of unknown function (DUF1588)/Protein of unknown function (DUF1585)/Protein of unknown function (DUF1595)/Protein of unknown function (DUF1587)